MKIALTGPSNNPIGSRPGGGITTFLGYLAQELTKRNHQVDVYTINSSQVSGNKIAIQEKGSIELGLSLDKEPIYNIAGSLKTMALLAQCGPYDIIHENQANLYSLIKAVELPHCLSTLHTPTNNFALEQALAITPSLTNNHFVAISQAQIEDSRFSFLDLIPHGIPLHDYPYCESDNGYIAWVGRIHPDKGIQQALSLCHQLGIPFQFGGSQANNEAYYTETLALAQRYNYPYLGHVSNEERNKLFCNARAFLFPMQQNEPFGFTMIEAMACGTPVVTYRRGSAKELIVDGETGYLCPPGDEEALKQAIIKIMSLPESQYRAMRQACRARVAELYTIEKMVDAYEAVYTKIRDRR